MKYFIKLISLLLLVLLIANTTCNGQQDRFADSIHTLLNKAADTAKPTLYTKAAFHYQAQQPDTTIDLANEALKLSKQFNDSINEMNAIVALAMAYQYKSENYKSTDIFLSFLNSNEKK